MVWRKWPEITVVLWLAACSAGLWALLEYSNTAGAPSTVGDALPAELATELDQALPTLLLFAHPKCGCTQATFSELERLQARCDGQFAIRVVFFEPPDADPTWRTTSLWNRARALPHASAIVDPGGRLTAGIGATTSGTAALFHPNGELVFWGGLTASRGHEGKSTGTIALRRHITGVPCDVSRTPVFGCRLLPEEPRAQRGLRFAGVTDVND